jgi:hypothetical protein
VPRTCPKAFVPRRQRFKLLAQIAAVTSAALAISLLLVEHFQHRESRRRGHGVAAERREETELRLESFDQRAVGDDHTHRIAVAHRLAQVTMSGLKPRRSNPQKCEPQRPNPYCTSSATISRRRRARALNGMAQAGGGS